MCSVGLAGKTKRKFKATTHSKQNLAVTDKHLDRQFAVHQPEQVVGWSMDGDMRATLINDALLMAIGKRKPDKGLLWRSDRGSHNRLPTAIGSY